MVGCMGRPPHLRPPIAGKRSEHGLDPRDSREGRWFAALLAAGPDAVLSHQSAAALWQRFDKEELIEVSVARRRTPRPGVRVDEARRPDADVTTRHGIPVTTPIRTLRDLAQSLKPDALEEPKPTGFNVPMEIDGKRIEVDVLWRDQRLIVELDGRAAHTTTDAFHEDRARDQDLVAAGFRVIRITSWQLGQEAERIADVTGRLLV
jgi:very-short-patch-repair endonuclease